VMDPFSGDSDSSYDIFDLQLSAGTYVAGWADSADGEAVIDPVIVVDPAFENADQYTVLLNAGLVNGGAAPQPIPAVSILGRVVLAAGLMGAAARRRR